MTVPLASRVLDGDPRAIARAITLIEGESPQAAALVRQLYPHSGRAYLVGVTGPPGAGKSTFVDRLTAELRRRGPTVGIVAVDPTSPFSGGALLGDRVRMRDLAGDPGIFIRSMATRDSLGGLAQTTADVVMTLDAAGFARVIIETVGVGQSEVEIASTAHTTIVVEAPGLGDEVQAIKAGILEIADIFAVNKADREGADRTVMALQMMLALGGTGHQQILHHGRMLPVDLPPAPPADDWTPPIHKTVATQNQGIAALVEAIEAHRGYLQHSGLRQTRDRLRAATELRMILRDLLLQRTLAAIPAADIAALVHAVAAREIDPYSAAQRLVARTTS